MRPRFPRRDVASGLCKKRPLRAEGAGNAGCPMHPQPRVRMKKAHEHVTTGTPNHSGIPCAMVLTVSFEFSPETGLFVSVIPEKRQLPRNLTPASGCQDDTTSPSACKCVRRSHFKRPSHPAPTFVTTRTPLWWDGTGQSIELFPANRQVKNFAQRHWTRICVACPSGKSLASKIEIQPKNLNPVCQFPTETQRPQVMTERRASRAG